MNTYQEKGADILGLKASDVLLGSGSFGDVFVCESKEKDQRFALKVIRRTPDEALDDADFRREVDILSALRHKRIVRYINSCTQDGLKTISSANPLQYVFIQLEYCDGGTLEIAMDKQRFRDRYYKFWLIFRDTLEGLQFLDDHRIIHRDIKPSNILLTRDGQAKIADFGVATLADKVNLTYAPGTKLYNAPETSISHNYSTKADMYSCGIVFYELVVSLEEGYDRYKLVELFASERRKKFFKYFGRSIENAEAKAARKCVSLMTQESPQRRPSPAKLLDLMVSGARNKLLMLLRGSSRNARIRLKSELKQIRRQNFPPGIYAEPLASDMSEWHYVIYGAPQTVYEGGIYHGKLIFPRAFPFKPPAIYMATPSGRFAVNERCKRGESGQSLAQALHFFQDGLERCNYNSCPTTHHASSHEL